MLLSEHIFPNFEVSNSEVIDNFIVTPLGLPNSAKNLYAMFYSVILKYIIIITMPCNLFVFRGHPFITSTRRGEGARLRWTGGGVQAPCGRPHRKLKLESTDVIQSSSSHAKKLASFLPEFRLWTE